MQVAVLRTQFDQQEISVMHKIGAPSKYAAIYKVGWKIGMER